MKKDCGINREELGKNYGRLWGEHREESSEDSGEQVGKQLEDLGKTHIRIKEALEKNQAKNH